MEEHSRWRNGRCKATEAEKSMHVWELVKSLGITDVWGAECEQ